MWPKALAQLLELLPHASRLLPMVDRLLSNRSASEEASQKALSEMQAVAGGLREDLVRDLGQVTASHAGLYRQMNEMSAKVDEAARDARAAQQAASVLVARLGESEATLARLQRLTTIVIVLLCLIVLLLPFLFYFVTHR